MKKTLKRMTSAAMALVMAIGIGATAASAAGPYADGNYTAKAAFLHGKQDKPSMCSVMFDHDADVKVTGENTEISIYAAFPVPAFPDAAPDGTLKDVVLTIDGTAYTAVADNTTKPSREFDETNTGFGLEAGKSYTTQILTFTIPTAKLDSLANPTAAKAFVVPIMNMNVNFRFTLTGITAVAPEVTPDATETKGMQITADVQAPAATYTVTIPETVAMGSLSRDTDTVTAYKVDVTAENLGNGYVEVSAPSTGVLKNAENELAFANSFGAQKTSVTGSMDGQFTVTAADVASAVAGNYTGTATFTIRYFAG